MKKQEAIEKLKAETHYLYRDNDEVLLVIWNIIEPEYESKEWYLNDWDDLYYIIIDSKFQSYRYEYSVENLKPIKCSEIELTEEELIQIGR